MNTEEELIQQTRDQLASFPVQGNLNFELFLYAMCAAGEQIKPPDTKRITDGDQFFNVIQYKVDAVLDGLANKVFQYKKRKGQLDGRIKGTTADKR